MEPEIKEFFTKIRDKLYNGTSVFYNNTQISELLIGKQLILISFKRADIDDFIIDTNIDDFYNKFEYLTKF